MANDLIGFRDWLDANHGNVEMLLHAATETINKLAPKAHEQGRSVADLVNDDPVTVRALLDGVNIASIAGFHGVTVENVMEVLGQVLTLTTMVSAVF